MRLPTNVAIALGLAIASSFSDGDTNVNAVSIYTGYDDYLCDNASTASIEEGGCDGTELLSCTAFNVGGSGTTTYYGQHSCGDSRDSYVESTFGNAPIFMVEYYEDDTCNKLMKTNVYLADGACHYFTLGTMKIWVAEDKSMAALTVSGNCDSDDWSVVMDMNKSVNTGTCIASDDAAGVKYVLVENLLIGNTPISTPIPTRDESKVSVFTGNDDPSCNEPSTATIREGGCGDTDLFECTQKGTYYGQCTCSSSRDDYLQSAFKNSGVFMIEYYNDVNCNKLVSTDVYRADGKCHYFTFGVMKIWVAQDNSMAALLTSTNCESNDWYIALDLNVSVNTGACIPNNDYFSKAEKYVFVGDPSSNTLPTPNSSNYGKRLWPDRGHSLCTREFGATNICRDFDDGLSGTYLLQLSNQLVQHKQLMKAYLPQNGFYGISELPSPPEHLLQFYILVNRKVFNLWKVACIRNYNQTRPQELEYCQCVNQQLIHGISIARRIQHLIGQYELDSEWCELLKQRDEMLYQEAHSVLSDLCDRDLGERFYKQRRAFLDSILC